MKNIVIISILGLLISGCGVTKYNIKGTDKRLVSYAFLHNATATAVKREIRNGADVNAVDTFGERPLYKAVWADNLEATEVLLKNGADVHIGDIDDKYHNYPLGSAKSVKAVDLLVKYGANVQGVNSRYPLAEAAYYGRNEVVERLIELGADVNFTSGSGLYRSSVLDNAISQGHTSIVALLKKHGAYVTHSEAVTKETKEFEQNMESARNIASAVAGAVIVAKTIENSKEPAHIANNNFSTNSGNVSNNIASASGCSPLPPRCQSANASAERNLVSCKSQDTGGIRGAALMQECGLKAAIYAGKICESEFRKIGAQQCEYQMKQQVNAWNNALISARQTIRQVSGSSNSGGSSVFNGGNEQRARLPRRGGEVGKCPPGQYPDGNATATGCGPILR